MNGRNPWEPHPHALFPIRQSGKDIANNKTFFAIADENSALDAEFMKRNGLKLGARYSGITTEQEHDAVRDAAGMYDLTAFRKLWLKEPDARAVLDKAFTRDVTKLKPTWPRTLAY